MFPDAIDPDAPVLVLGAAGVDIIARPQQVTQTGTSTPAHIRSSFGGVARNVSENLARLGHPVSLITVIGADQIGKQLRQFTASTGVNLEASLQTSHHPTGTYVALIDSDGQLMFALDDMRAIEALTPAYLRKQSHLFKESSLLFIDANLPPKTMKTAFSMAEKYNLPVCADPTSNVLAYRLQDYFNQLHILTPNSQEAAILSGRVFDPTKHEEALDAAKVLLNQGVDFAIITLAEFGLSYATSENSGHIPALRTEIVDPTGAGDALTAAVIFALLNEIPPDEAVRLGVTSASLTLRHRGTVLPDLSLEKLYDHLVI